MSINAKLGSTKAWETTEIEKSANMVCLLVEQVNNQKAACF